MPARQPIDEDAPAGERDLADDANMIRLITSLARAAGDYADVQRTRIRLRLHAWTFSASAFFVGVLIAIIIVPAAILLILGGILGCLTELFDGRWWPASLVTGVGIVVAGSGAVWLGERRFRRRLVNSIRDRHENAPNQRRRCTE
jgi:membrane protein DedA with SNARE-associated domain